MKKKLGKTNFENGDWTAPIIEKPIRRVEIVFRKTEERDLFVCRIDVENFLYCLKDEDGRRFLRHVLWAANSDIRSGKVKEQSFVYEEGTEQLGNNTPVNEETKDSEDIGK